MSAHEEVKPNSKRSSHFFSFLSRWYSRYRSRSESSHEKQNQTISPTCPVVKNKSAVSESHKDVDLDGTRALIPPTDPLVSSDDDSDGDIEQLEQEVKAKYMSETWRRKNPSNLINQKESLGGLEDNDETLDKAGSLLKGYMRERGFVLLGFVSLVTCAFCLFLHSYLAYRSHQMMHLLQAKREIPEMLYKLYFEADELAMDGDKVDLRVNTSIFVH